MKDNMLTEKEVMKALEVARERLMDAEKEVKKYVKNDPGKAMLIAAGVGAAIGAVLTVAIEKEMKKEERL